MNILFVCSAKSWGGNEKWTTMAIKTLAEKHQLFFFGRKKSLGNRFAPGIPQEFAPMFANWDLFSFFKAYGFVKKNQIDLIVSTKKKEYFIFGLIARILKIKHLIRLGIVRDMNRPIWHNLIYNKLNDGIIANAHKIESNLRQFKFMENKPVHVIYNTVPGLQKLIKTPLQHTDKFHIVSTGMLTKRKGFHILIDAISKLSPEQKSQLQVSFIGEGRDRDSFEQLVQQNKLEDVITFTGFQKDPTAILSTANLFVLLSENEGISNALLEAMAMGIPVLTTDSGGTTEFIKTDIDGIIVERNVKAVAEKLNYILQNPSTLPFLGENGQKKIKKLFSEQRFREELYHIVST